MVTIEQLQAMNGRGELHEEGCRKTVGPRGGVKFRCVRWRLNGMLHTWATRPGEFRQPVEFCQPVAAGLYQHTYITHLNAHLVHTAADCPVEELRQ